MNIPQRTKTLSLILKTIIILSAIAGTVMSVLSTGEFMNGRSVFMYFTIQSNIALAAVSLIGAVILIGNKNAGNAWFVVKLVATVSITLTGVVFCAVLAPTLKEGAWSAANILTHVIVPVVSVIDYYVICAYGNLSRKHVIFVIIPPIAYAVYAGIGYVNNWDFAAGLNYPYFFLNWGSPAGAFGFSKELPFMGCVWWILVLLLFLVCIGNVYVVTLNRFRKKQIGN